MSATTTTRHLTTDEFPEHSPANTARGALLLAVAAAEHFKATGQLPAWAKARFVRSAARSGRTRPMPNPGAAVQCEKCKAILAGKGA